MCVCVPHAFLPCSCCRTKQGEVQRKGTARAPPKKKTYILSSSVPTAALHPDRRPASAAALAVWDKVASQHKHSQGVGKGKTQPEQEDAFRQSSELPLVNRSS